MNRCQIWSLIFVLLSTLTPASAYAFLSCESIFNQRTNLFQSYSAKHKYEHISDYFAKNRDFRFTDETAELFGETLNVNIKNENELQLSQLELKKNTNAVGYINQGIYYLDFNKHPIVIKVFDMAPHIFMSVVMGSLIGEQWGGPRIYSFGYFKLNGENKTSFYIAMERLFPNEPSYSLKHDSQKIDSIIKSNSHFLKSLAYQLVSMFKNNIYLNDIDLLINDAGEYRWLDTDFWVYTSSVDDKWFVLRNVITYLSRENVTNGFLFLNLLRNELHKQNYDFIESDKLLGLSERLLGNLGDPDNLRD